MPVVEQLDSEAIERLRKQSGFLLGIYHAEIAKDPTSRATESSRSNVIAMQHTVKQLYGEAVARGVAGVQDGLNLTRLPALTLPVAPPCSWFNTW